MKLSGFKRIVKEDYKSDQQELIDKLGDSINSFAEQIVSAFNHNISIADNLLISYKQITLKVDSSGSPILTTQFTNPLANNLKIQGIIVIKAQNLTTTTAYPTSCPFVSFSQVNNLVNVLNVTGLQANNSYILNLEVRG